MQIDPLRMDGHKLHLHPGRVADWLEGRNVAPIVLDVTLSGACNHRCRFCALDYVGYQTRFQPTENWLAKLPGLAETGVKAVIYAGEGEPLLHRQAAEIIVATKAAGLDAAMLTNGVLLTADISRQILPALSWIRFSINAGTEDAYARIHRGRPQDFRQVFENVAAAVRLKRETGSRCTLGVQMLMLPENLHEVLGLALAMRELGVDYFTLKPYVDIGAARHREYRDLVYPDCSELEARLKELNTAAFTVVFRSETMKQRLRSAPPAYGRCLGLPFMSYVDAAANVWGCCRHIGNPSFFFGSLADESPADIFNGPRRSEAIKRVSEKLDVTPCHNSCRQGRLNAYLWELRHPGAHVNFI